MQVVVLGTDVFAVFTCNLVLITSAGVHRPAAGTPRKEKKRQAVSPLTSVLRGLFSELYLNGRLFL